MVIHDMNVGTSPPKQQAEDALARILLVDDRPQNLKLMEIILKPLGQLLVSVLSGEEALRQILNEKFAVILLDVQMPGIDGIETARLIRARKDTQDTPIIFVTGAGRDEKRINDAYSLGAIDYVFKPVSPDIIRAKVSDFVELFKSKRRTAQLLARSEALLADTSRLAKIGGWELDIKTLELTWTEQTYRIHEIPLGQTPSLDEAINFFHPDDLPKLESAFQHALEQGEPFDLQLRLVTAQGNQRWTQTICKPIVEDGRIIRVSGTLQDISERKETESRLVGLHQQLLEQSRRAGMAEVATTVLHNVGNVLNSINVCSSLVAEKVRKSRIGGLSRTVTLLQEHKDDLAGFFTNDSRGAQLPVYLDNLSRFLTEEREEIIGELSQLGNNVEHVKEIIAMQQGYAKVSSVSEMIDLSELVEGSLGINQRSLERHEVEVIRDYGSIPPFKTEKHKLMQVLVNLIQNAGDACAEAVPENRQLKIKLRRNKSRIRISVADNGVGIDPANVAELFNYGFTTKDSGNGFGLYSSALTVQEMGGSLGVHSDGPGLGATFTLELPHLSEQNPHE